MFETVNAESKQLREDCDNLFYFMQRRQLLAESKDECRMISSDYRGKIQNMFK